MVKVCSNEYNNKSFNKYFEKYAFELSDFQKYAIESIVEGHHCLITAHTGSGKTLPAEFAIELMKSKNKKLIYTSPIKALSNQKFYDFKNKFPEISIGLFTGDIKTNPEADVLIMTTEILMNYLFNLKDSDENKKYLDFELDVKNELGCVVFDEVHYINDVNRGEVWEKTILMLPDHIQMIMLSATIESPEKFAKWCEKGKKEKIVYLCSTNKRVVPLSHYSYLTNMEIFYKKLKDKDKEREIRNEMKEIIEIQDANGNYNEKNVDKIKDMLESMKKKEIYMKKSNVLNNLCKYLKEKEMLPGIVFIFSRKQVESTAKEITTNLLEDDSKIPYIVKKECDLHLRKLPNYQEYLELDEYKELIKLLEKGIGIHHSGMIPVFKEIVELMISKKYIKLLFATESFAIGLDCPIKSAIFPSLTKFDGNSNRELFAHEYTQMAGRAGRRGLDKVGYVIHCNNLFEMPNKSNYKRILGGVPQTLTSKYHVTYSVILNLIKNDKSEDLVNFSKRTMLNESIEKYIKEREEKYSVELKEKEEGGNLLELENNMKVLEDYKELLESIKYLKGNKLKKQNIKIMKMKNEYKNLELDYEKYMERNENNKKLNDMKSEIEILKGAIKENTENICMLLENEKFIKKENNLYILLEKGDVCSHINEINNMVFTNLLFKTNKFEKYSDIEIISSLSYLVSLKTEKGDEKKIVNYKNNNIDEIVNMLNFELDGYIIIEGNYKIWNTGIDYKEKTPELPELVEEWILSENEIECKRFLKEKINGEYKIMTGEFVKTLLKLCAMNKEIIKMSLSLSYIDLANKLQNIENKILKYVITPQSLYL
jgi:superfamily II RNA helicase